MYQKNYLNNYKTTQILTADPGKIILMLLDGAVSFLDQAMQHGQQKQLAEKTHFIQRTRNILFELLSSLDFEAGEEVARNLREIYTFLLGELFKADLKNDIPTIKKCQQVLSNLRDGWSEMLESSIEPIAAEAAKHQQQQPAQSYSFSSMA